MARLAIRGKAARDVIWIRGALEVLHVARGAGSIGGTQIVVVVYVAGSARHAYVRAGQGKPSGIVVKIGLKPCIHSVASLAICGKARRNVIGRNCTLKIAGVARIALRR